MKIHGWEHTGEKPFKCPKCERGNTRLLKRMHNYTDKDLIKANLHGKSSKVHLNII